MADVGVREEYSGQRTRGGLGRDAHELRAEIRRGVEQPPAVCRGLHEREARDVLVAAARAAALATPGLRDATVLHDPEHQHVRTRGRGERMRREHRGDDGGEHGQTARRTMKPHGVRFSGKPAANAKQTAAGTMKNAGGGVL